MSVKNVSFRVVNIGKNHKNHEKINWLNLSANGLDLDLMSFKNVGFRVTWFLIK